MFSESFVNFDKRFISKKYVSGKILLVMSYIRLNASYNGKVSFSIDYLVESLGYKVNRKPNKINQNIVDALEWLRSNGYLNYDLDITNIKNHSKTFQCIINDDNNIFEVQKGENNLVLPFVQLLESEFDKIVHSPLKRKDWLLAVFLHMKKRICINGLDRESKYCFASLDTIVKDVSKNVDISKTSVTKVIDELVRVGLFCEHITGSYIDCHGKIKTAVNYYALSEDEMNHAECNQLAQWYIEDNEGLNDIKFIK